MTSSTFAHPSPVSVVVPHAASQAARAAAWARALEELGARLPAFASHDLGLVLTEPLGRITLRTPTDPRAGAWAALVREVAGGHIAAEARALGLSDDFVVALLGRALAPLSGADDELATVATARRRIVAALDALDLDVARLFALAGGDAEGGALAHVDLAAAMGHPDANDVASLSLEILPHVLDRRSRVATSRSPRAGYAGLSRRGSFDSMVLTELAHDDEELARRVLDDEVLHYARDEAEDPPRRLHVALIDASASMRGDRATFARATAVTVCKKLVLAGEPVVFRFFDARLHPPHPSRGSRLPLAYLLGFRGERGRHPGKVMRHLARELEAMASRDPREIAVHLFTHAALHVPGDAMRELTRVARVTAIFLLPSGGDLDLDYLDLLDAHFVIDHASLTSRSERAAHARSVVDAIGPGSTRGPAS